MLATKTPRREENLIADYADDTDFFRQDNRITTDFFDADCAGYAEGFGRLWCTLAGFFSM